jgi:UDP-GlcNAc:undecaprenyl-phosphate/decaprenyl-phosphate GlcNAc-1-phosphate transferase
MLSNTLIVAVISFALSLGLTYAVRELARRYGFVAKPKSDRWHKRPTAMMGGVSIFLTTTAASLIFLEHTRELYVLLSAGAFLFLVGLIDDILHIKPYQKLIGQLIGAAIIVSFGLTLQWTSYEFINIGLTVFWLIGIANAINLLDNMDGLAAGIAAIAAFSLALGFASGGQPFELMLVAAFTGALVGFLVFNFNPASIFMGDCGSMFVGFFLASMVLTTQTGGRSRGIVSILAVPALILFVPIFDTTFVTVLRKIWGRKASQGGRDHTSHRLVALGLSERSAVLLLYGFAILAGSLSLLVRELQITQSIALILLFIIALTIVGVYLSKVKVYEEQDEELALREKKGYAFLYNLSHKRRIFEVFLDVLLITLCYYASYIFLFGELENTTNWDLFIKSVPLLIVINLFSFLLVGVYRGIWRYTGIGDLVTFAKGVALGTALSVLAILLLYRFKDFSRTLFVLNALLLLASLSISRMAFRFFRQLLPSPMNGEGRNVLIYGAGDGGEMVLRELKNNPEWKYTPIGFVDDDPVKKDKVIHGLKVFGGNGSLPKICRENDVQEILISFRNISDERIKEVREAFRDTEISLKRAQLKIEPIEFE